jgi:hypothetical protein
MMPAARACLPLLLALLCAGSFGCRAWSHAYLDFAMVEPSPDAPCATLLDAARKDAWSASVRGTERSPQYRRFAMAVSVEDTWVMWGEVERTPYGSAIPASNRRIQEYRGLALRCGAYQQPLPHRTCRRAGRAYAIVDGRAIGRLPARWGDSECRVEGEVRVGRRWEALRYPVELHPSLRRVVEGR